MYGYSFELITGPMSCGKTEELLRRIKRCIIAKKKVKVISPDVDTRSKGDYIESRNGLWLDAIKVKHSIQILSIVKPEDEVYRNRRTSFFEANIVKVIAKLMEEGQKVSVQVWNGV
jgi:thymidine kinase